MFTTLLSAARKADMNDWLEEVGYLSDSKIWIKKELLTSIDLYFLKEEGLIEEYAVFLNAGVSLSQITDIYLLEIQHRCYQYIKRGYEISAITQEIKKTYLEM